MRMTSTRRGEIPALLAAVGLAAVFLPAPVAEASHRETVHFTAMGDNTLSTDIVASEAAVEIEDGVPEVFHSFGSQASRYPAGFKTVPGPFDQPGEPFDAVVIAATAHRSAPASANFTFQIKNGTTNELITELTTNTTRVDNIPLDDDSESAPLSDHCSDAAFSTDYSAVAFQITLAPEVHEVVVGPHDDLQLILTPEGIFGGRVELCVEHSTFYTGLGLVIEPFPSPPVAVDDSATTSKNTSVTVDVLGNDSDADGDALSVANLTTPANGSVVDNGDGTIGYTPNTGFEGLDSFTYTANDGSSDSNVATVTVDVRNTPPSAIDDAASTFKNTPVTVDVLANDSDADADALSVTFVGAAANGATVDNGDGTVTYTPNAGYSGSDSFAYTLSDGTDLDTATVSIEVINRPPDCSAAGPSADGLWPPDRTFTSVVVVGVTDPDGDAVTITVDSIYQDEPTSVFAPDGSGLGTSTAEVRRARAGGGDGRVYHVGFTADDGDAGSCTGIVLVGVPHDQDGQAAVDGGALFDSTL